MGVTGSFSVPAESFTLHDALVAAPEVTVEADRIASHSTTEVLPFLWVVDEGSDRFRRALAHDPTVTEYSVAEEMDDEVLYRVQWFEEFRALIDEIVNHHAAILEATARDGE